MSKSLARILFILSIACFGTIGVITRYIPLCSSGIVFYRALIASTFLIFISIVTHRKFAIVKIKQNLSLFILAGFFMGFNWVFQFEAFNVTSVSVGTACYNTMPIFVILITPFMFKVKISIKSIVCVLIAMLGILFVSNIFITGIKSTEIIGCAYGLIGGLFYALVVMMTKKMTDIDSIDKIIVEFIIAMIIMVPYILLNKNSSFVFYENITTKEFAIGIAFLLILGIVHTGIAYIVYYNSVNLLSPYDIAIFTYIDPVVALILSYFILHEKMNILQLVGTILILGSTFVANIDFDKKKICQKK